MNAAGCGSSERAGQGHRASRSLPLVPGRAPATPAAQTRECLHRVGRALAALGAGLDDVVEIEAQAVMLA